MSAAVSFGNIYLYPFASSLRDGKVEHTYRLKIPSETEPKHPTDFFTTLSVHRSRDEHANDHLRVLLLRTIGAPEPGSTVG